MTMGSLLLLVAKVTVVLGAAVLIVRVLRGASASARHLVWLTALVAALSLPLLELSVPVRLAILPSSIPAAVPPRAATSGGDHQTIVGDPTTRNGSTERTSPARAVPELVATPTLPVAPVTALRDVSRLSTSSVLFLLWLGGALAVITWLVRGWVAVRGIVRRAHVVNDAAWLTPLYEVADRLGLDTTPRLVQSAEARMPFACGLVSPTIVLPSHGDAWSGDRRRAVLLHELAHVERRDLIAHTLSWVVCAVYWFHPLAWMAASRLRAESEKACDDLAIGAGARAPDYAEHLLDIVTSVRTDVTPNVALAIARRSEFEGRMLAILDAERARRGVTRRQSAVLAGVMGAMTILVAAASPATTPSPPVASARPPKPVPSAPTDARIEGPTRPSDDRAAARLPWRDTQTRSDSPAITEREVEGSTANTELRSERVGSLARLAQTDSSATVRRAAVWGLKAFAAESASARAVLVAVLRQDADSGTREMAAWALAATDGSSDGVAALSEAVRRDDVSTVRATAAWSLGRLSAVAAAPALTMALGDRDRRVRIRAAWALGTINAPTASPALLAMLSDSSSEARHIATWAIQRSSDATAVPAVRAAMKVETNDEVRVAYLRTLATLGAKSPDAIQALLDSGDPSFRDAATQLLTGSHRHDKWPWPWPEARPSPSTIW